MGQLEQPVPCLPAAATDPWGQHAFSVRSLGNIGPTPLSDLFFRPSELFPAQRQRKGKGKVPPIPGSMKTRLSLCIGLIPTLIVCSLRAKKNLPTKAPSPTPCSHWPKSTSTSSSIPKPACFTEVDWKGAASGLRLPTSSRETSPWGYGSHIEDTSLHNGHALAALLDANSAGPIPPAGRDSPMLRRPETHRLPPETHPKPGKPAWSGSSSRTPCR